MIWIAIDDESCPTCGDSIEVNTALATGGFFDGDACRCMSCDFKSVMSVDEDGSSWIQDSWIGGDDD